MAENVRAIKANVEATSSTDMNLRKALVLLEELEATIMKGDFSTLVDPNTKAVTDTAIKYIRAIDYVKGYVQGYILGKYSKNTSTYTSTRSAAYSKSYPKTYTRARSYSKGGRTWRRRY